MEEMTVDCTTGQSALSPLSAAQAGQQATVQAQACAADRALAQEQAFRQQQQTALAGVAAALHGALAAPDASALAGLVHKLVADPPQPLSAPEMSTLARFMLRCLLP